MNPPAEHLLQVIKDQAFDFAVCVTDGELDLPGPRILYVNDRFEKLTGYSAAEVVGQSPRFLQGDKSDREVLARLKHTLASGGFFRGQTINYRKDGSEFLMAWSISGIGRSEADPDRPAMYLAVQHDAATSMAAEMMSEVMRCHLAVLGRIDPSLETVQVLRDQIEYANSIVDTVRTPLLVLDADLRVKRANRPFYRLFGLAENSVLGRPLYQIADAAWDHPDLRRLLDEVLPTKNPFDGFEMTREFPDVGGRTLVLSACQLPLHGARRELILLAFEDVTERRQAEAKLIDRANMFISMLAHELRNPLAPIPAALAILRTVPPTDPAWDRAARTVERQVTQSTKLIDDLLDVSRVTRGKIGLRPERVELRAVLEAAVETVQPLIEASGHDLRVTLPWKPVWLEADPTRLQQVFSNLLQNAAKYTPPGGRIDLEAAADAKAKALTVRVRDTGVGIDPAVLPTVFDVFVQEDRSLARAGGGLGLGLTVVRNLVELHGGSVSAASDGKDKGSVFTVTLPYQPAAEPAAPKPAADRPTGPAVRVAVIDDNADAADTSALLLRAWGHEAFTAYDGRAGLDLIVRERPDVVLLDIGLPGMNGYEVAKVVKSIPSPPVLVAVTGYGQDADKQRATWAGFDHHLTKPARPEEIARLLGEVSKTRKAATDGRG